MLKELGILNADNPKAPLTRNALNIYWHLLNVQSTKNDQTSSPCNTTYEVIDPATPEMQENEIYHVLNGETQNESLELQKRPATPSQGNNLPKCDLSIPKDVKSGDQQDANSFILPCNRYLVIEPKIISYSNDVKIVLWYNNYNCIKRKKKICNICFR